MPPTIRFVFCIIAVRVDWPRVLERLGDLENYPEEYLAPYEEFRIDANIYYFTPGGFLYRKDHGSEEVGGFFCGYLSDEVWHHRTDDG